MNLNEMNKRDNDTSQKILFLSYRQELYKTIYFHMAGRFDILYYRIRENTRIIQEKEFVLCMIEMLRFTDKSEELIQKIRNKINGPLLFISGVKTEEIRKKEFLRAFKSGVDGYLVSTQSIEEIVAEAKALIRLQTRVQRRPEIWTYQELQIVPGRRQVFLKEKEIPLTRMEFDIVQYLAMQNGRAVTYQELYEAVWHSEYLFDDDSIMAHIHRIRRKLETDRKHPFYIQNVYGVGYRFGCCMQEKF